MITIYYNLIGDTSLHYQKETEFCKEKFNLVVFNNLEEFNKIENKLTTPSVLRCTVNFIHEYLNYNQCYLTKDTRLYLNKKLYYNDNLNLYNCMQNIDNSLLLNTGIFIKLKDIENMQLSEPGPLFMKPSSVLKYFDATLVSNQYLVGEYLTFNNFNVNISEELCLLTSVKSIDTESRFFVINGEVISGSYYRISDVYLEKEINKEDYIFKIAQQYADKYSPCASFVMDLALYKGEYKIIEYNPINCAAIYACNYTNIINKLKE